MAAKNLLTAEIRLEGVAFFEIFEEFDHGAGFSDGVFGGVFCPDEFEGGAEGFVSWGRVL